MLCRSVSSRRPQLTISSDHGVCIGGEATISVTVSGGVGASTYQWQLFTTDWTDIALATSHEYTTVFTQLGSFQYRVIVTQGEGCESVSEISTSMLSDPRQSFQLRPHRYARWYVTISSTVMDPQVRIRINGSSIMALPDQCWHDNDTFVTPVLHRYYSYRLLLNKEQAAMMK